jgi:chromosome segregation ATPase
MEHRSFSSLPQPTDLDSSFNFQSPPIDSARLSPARKNEELDRLQLQHDEIRSREKRLRNRAQILLEQKISLARKRKKLEDRLTQSDLTYKHYSKRLQQQFDSFDQSNTPIPTRRVQVEKNRLRLETQINHLVQSLDSIAAVHEECENRIASLVASDWKAQIAQDQREIHEIRKAIEEAQAQERAILARLSVFEHDVEKIRNFRSRADLKIQAAQRLLLNSQSDEEKFMKKQQGRLDQVVARTAGVTEVNDKLHVKRSSIKAIIRTLTQKIFGAEEAERTLSGELHKASVGVAVLEEDMHSVRLKIRDFRGYYDEVHHQWLAQDERQKSLEIRIGHLGGEVEEIRTKTREVLFERDKTRVTLDQQQALLVDDELRMRDFYEIMDDIDSADRESFRLDERLRDLQSTPIDMEVMALDLGREKSVYRRKIEALSDECDPEKEAITLLNERMIMLNGLYQTKKDELAQMERKKTELVTITSALYSPTPYSPQGRRSSKSIRAEIEARVQSRKRRLEVLQSRTEKLEGKVMELSAFNSQRKSQERRREHLIEQRVQVSKEVIKLPGSTEELFLGLNSVHDFRRLLNDEHRSWVSLPAHQFSAALAGWEKRLNELFEELDVYYLK